MLSENGIYNFVKDIFAQSEKNGKEWNYGWIKSDTMKCHCFNPISGEAYNSFDSFVPMLDDDLYITKTQAQQLGCDLSGVTIRAGRFFHVIKGLSNHGKNAKMILESDLAKELNTLDLMTLQARANLTEIRESNTRHYVVSVQELIKLYPTNQSLIDLYDRFRLFEIDNDLPFAGYCAKNNIKLLTGVNRQACNIYFDNGKRKENLIVLASVFKTPQNLIRTYLHELTHASRFVCNDSIRLPKAIEESIAECGSYYLQLMTQSKYEVLDYVAHWLCLANLPDTVKDKLAKKVAKHLTIRLNSILEKKATAKEL